MELFEDNGLHLGMVVDDQDEQKLGRVSVIIPGIMETPMWARVMMPGSPFQRGIFVVPYPGAEVAVGFLDGDREQPVVVGGFAPPVESGGARAQVDALDVRDTIAIENHDFTVRLGAGDHPYVDIAARPVGDEAEAAVRIQMDGEQGVIRIYASQAITEITPGLLHMDGRLAQVRDRVIQEGDEPI